MGELCATRQILHIDLDGFYAQVEQKRVGLPDTVPLAVQQWQGIIAINYAAKHKGVTRFMKIKEAKAVCPDLVFVHVRTIGGEPATGSLPADADADADALPSSATSDSAAAGCSNSGSAAGGSNGVSAAAAAAGPPGGGAASGTSALGVAGGGGSILEGAGARSTAKACLQRYRVASSEILQVLQHGLSHNAVMEKGGLDEVYLDVTPMVDAELRAMGEGHGGLPAEALVELAREAVQCSVLEGGVQVDLEHEGDRRLVVAAMIAKRLRDAVRNDPACGYTCSAGVASNKLLAKIGSARNKPAQQTLVLPRAVAGLMQGLPLGKIKGLGGKLGAFLHELCGSEGTAGDVQQAPWDVLVRAAGAPERAQWVYNIVRGIDDEPVKPKGPIKSLNSCKSITATSDKSQITRWLGILADELAERCVEDEWEHRRRPRTLVLHFRKDRCSERSIRCTMPLPPQGAGRGEAALSRAIFGAATTLFKRTSDPLPCVRLALSATDFHSTPVEGASAITHFFTPTQAAPSRPPLKSPPRAAPSSHVAPAGRAAPLMQPPPSHATPASSIAPLSQPPLSHATPASTKAPLMQLQPSPGTTSPCGAHLQVKQQQQQQQQQQQPVWGGVLLPPGINGSIQGQHCQQHHQQQHHHHHQQQQQQQQPQGDQESPNQWKRQLDALLTPSKRPKLVLPQQGSSSGGGGRRGTGEGPGQQVTEEARRGEPQQHQGWDATLGGTLQQERKQQQQQQQQQGGRVYVYDPLRDLLGGQGAHAEDVQPGSHPQQQQQLQPLLPNVRDCLHSILGDPHAPSAVRGPASPAFSAAVTGAAAGAPACVPQRPKKVRSGAAVCQADRLAGAVVAAAAPAPAAGNAQAGGVAGGTDTQECIEEVEDGVKGEGGGRGPGMQGTAAAPTAAAAAAAAAAMGAVEVVDMISPDPPLPAPSPAPALPHPDHLLATGLWSPGELVREQQLAGEQQHPLAPDLWSPSRSGGHDGALGMAALAGMELVSGQTLLGIQQQACPVQPELGDPARSGGLAGWQADGAPGTVAPAGDELQPPGTGVLHSTKGRQCTGEQEPVGRAAAAPDGRQLHQPAEAAQAGGRGQPHLTGVHAAGSGQHPQPGTTCDDEDAKLLAGVSLEEQRRILRDLELQRLREAARGVGAQGAVSSNSVRGRGSSGARGGGRGRGRHAVRGRDGGDKKQASLLAMFQKQG